MWVTAIPLLFKLKYPHYPTHFSRNPLTGIFFHDFAMMRTCTCLCSSS